MTEEDSRGKAASTVEAARYDDSDLIKEAYINPIRSVVVVDDEFPCLDTLLDNIANGVQTWGGKSTDLDAARGIVTFCRQRDKPWLVDIHDVKGAQQDGELKMAPHLHHSDLMVLDYHLDGDEGSGEKAISILRTLAANNHFNIVVIYTKGYTGDLTRVFREIVISLNYNNYKASTDDVAARVRAAVGEWEQSDDLILTKLTAMVSEDTYLRERSDPESAIRSEDGRRLIEETRKRPNGIETTPKDLLGWLLDGIHSRLRPVMSVVDLGVVSWNLHGNINWIRTDRLFVTVMGKSRPPAELEQYLISALCESDPAPYRLLMSKMRAQLDDKGVGAESEVLNDFYVQAGWLLEMFSKEKRGKSQLIRKTVDRHWEALGDRLRIDVEEYAGRIVDAFTANEERATISRYVPGRVSSDKSKIFAHVNKYYNTKPISLSHLTTGHVLSIPGALNEAPTYWVCLSPACDLVPGQKDSGWFARLGTYMPFIAVQIQSVPINAALQNATHNIYLFLQFQDAIQAFTYYPSQDMRQNPLWEQMFAADQGQLSAEGTIAVSRLSDANGTLGPTAQLATVVAQLRYEYALNLLQRLGSTLSRIGLDFKSLK